MPGTVEGQLFVIAQRSASSLRLAVHSLLLMTGRSIPDREVTGWSAYFLTMELEIGSKGIFDAVVFARLMKIHLSPSTPITTFALVSLVTSQYASPV